MAGGNPPRKRGILLSERGVRVEDWLSRQRMLIGEEACRRLNEAKIAVIGLGGVGGACVEGLCRAGIGTLILVDHDTVDYTNLNRQLIATVEMVGLPKTEACRRRVLSINPGCHAEALEMCYTAETSEKLFELKPDYVVDCIDMVTAKLHLAETCREKGIPLLMALGTGNRLDPSSFRIGTIADTVNSGGCGLARVMRRELRKRGITDQKVLYSVEPPAKTVVESSGRYAPGSISYCPPAAGFFMAGQVIRDILGLN